VQNFFFIFLPDSLFTYNIQSFTTIVDTFLLIMRSLSSLSAILNSGANIISLYLFSAKKSGKVTQKVMIYSFYP